PGAGAVEAFRQTVHLTGSLNWDYVLGPSGSLFAGVADDLGRVASLAVVALFVAGLATCALRAARGARRVAGWPWLAFDDDGARRALLLVWLVCVWLAHVVSAPSRVFPHYLLVSYPVSFLVAALGLSDLVAPTRSRRAATGLVVAVAAVYVA